MVTLAAACLVFFVSATGMSAAQAEHDRSELIHALEGQLEILKWSGGTMVTGLVGSVIALFKSLSTARREQVEMQKEIRDLLLKVTEHQANSNLTLATALDELREHCQMVNCEKHNERKEVHD